MCLIVAQTESDASLNDKQTKPLISRDFSMVPLLLNIRMMPLNKGQRFVFDLTNTGFAIPTSVVARDEI